MTYIQTPPPPLHSLLIFGAGYVGLHLARALQNSGTSVYVTTRSPDKATVIKATGAVPVIFGTPLPNVSHSVVTNPPLPDGTDPVLAAYGGHFPATITWVGYLSSTGVYGDHHGALVTEDSPLLAAAPHSVARLKAEQAWQAQNLPLEIFRLSGIYGPGRNMLERLKKGTIEGLEQSDRPVNRIHVEDIVTTLLAAMHSPDKGGVYNLADDDPAPTSDVIRYAAKLLGVSVPATDTRASHLVDGSRIVDNTRIKKHLNIHLKYPSYKDGLAALVRAKT